MLRLSLNDLLAAFKHRIYLPECPPWVAYGMRTWYHLCWFEVALAPKRSGRIILKPACQACWKKRMKLVKFWTRRGAGSTHRKRILDDILIKYVYMFIIVLQYPQYEFEKHIIPVSSTICVVSCLRHVLANPGYVVTILKVFFGWLWFTFANNIWLDQSTGPKHSTTLSCIQSNLMRDRLKSLYMYVCV